MHTCSEGKKSALVGVSRKVQWEKGVRSRLNLFLDNTALSCQIIIHETTYIIKRPCHYSLIDVSSKPRCARALTRGACLQYCKDTFLIAKTRLLRRNVCGRTRVRGSNRYTHRVICIQLFRPRKNNFFTKFSRFSVTC